MPLIRSSQEVYNYLKKRSGETGEPMSILLDRWFVDAKQLDEQDQKDRERIERKAKDGRDTKNTGRVSSRAKRSVHKARKRAEEAPKWLWGLEGLISG